MTQFFQNYFQFALEATIIVCIALAVRPLFRRYSKRIASLLWVAVFFRLLCPITIEGPIPAFWEGWAAGSQEKVTSEEGERYEKSEAGQSVKDNEELLRAAQDIGSSQAVQGAKADQDAQGSKVDTAAQTIKGAEVDPITQGPKVDSATQDIKVDKTTQGAQGIEVDQSAQGISDQPASAEKDGGKADGIIASVDVRGKSLINVLGVIWAFGAIGFLLFGVWTYVRLSKKLEEAIPVGKWEKYPVRSSDVSGVPMSFGVLRRGIYVPVYFDERKDDSKNMSEQEKDMILHHEAMHLRRRDPLWKLISFLALCMHWWNPLVWLCIRAFHKDLEMACDEGVLERLGQEKRGEYANALLHFAKRQSGLSLSAAFGESDAESRIKEALRYQKRPAGLSILMLCLVVLLAGCLATKPAGGKEDATDEGSVSQSGEVPGEEKKTKSDVILEITNLEEAIAAYLPFRDIREMRTAPAGVPYFGYDEDWYTVFYIDELANAWKTEVSEKYQALLDPATALTTLVPLKGGSTTATWQDGFSSALVNYTFENGETAQYFMAKRGQIWYPYMLHNGKIITTSSKEATDSLIYRCDRIRWRNKKLSQTTADELRKVTLRAEDKVVDYGRNSVRVDEVEADEENGQEEGIRLASREDSLRLACWDPVLYGEYCILQEIPEEDACLYGLYDGYAMMLRVGNQAYPLHGYWINIHCIMPQLYCGDYDNDGQKEYALITEGKTGTGTYGNWLRILEITKDGLEIHEPKSQGMYGQLEQKVRYQYNEKNLMLRVETTDGDVAFASLEDIELLASGEAQFLWLGYSQSESFYVKDDSLFYDASGEIHLTNKGDPEYGGIDINCQLQYSEDGSFGIENIQLNKAWTGPVEETDFSVELQDGKKVIACDITHNGMPDTLIVDYAAIEKDRQAFLIIDARDEAGLFLWEDFLALPHQGWGKYYLCEWQGLVYLLRYHPLEDTQGTMIGGYEVFWLNQYGEEQILEERTLNSDTTKDYEKEAADFEEAIKAYLASSYVLASTWDGELSLTEMSADR
ncbi:MAG: M56 family metallopeptidase [Lachnospiraceae bacterium]|nr:M56 family metallopeptidase [Lachnospiraceae bacterium]